MSADYHPAVHTCHRTIITDLPSVFRQLKDRPPRVAHLTSHTPHTARRFPHFFHISLPYCLLHRHLNSLHPTRHVFSYHSIASGSTVHKPPTKNQATHIIFFLINLHNPTRGCSSKITLILPKADVCVYDRSGRG